MTSIRIAIVAATVTLASTLAGAVEAECRTLMCGLAGEIATAVQKGPHAAAQEAALAEAARGTTGAGSHDARSAGRKAPPHLQAAGKKRKAFGTRHRSAKQRLRQVPPPLPAAVMPPERDPVPVVEPDEVNAIDLAAGPAPDADSERAASADDWPADGIRNDEAARLALAAALHSRASQLRNPAPEPPAMSWFDRAWAVVAVALSAAQTAVRTLVG